MTEVLDTHKMWISCKLKLLGVKCMSYWWTSITDGETCCVQIYQTRRRSSLPLLPNLPQLIVERHLSTNLLPQPYPIILYTFRLWSKVFTPVTPRLHNSSDRFSGLDIFTDSTFVSSQVEH